MTVVIQHSLLAARFFATFGHFIALIVLFQTIENNIEAGLSDGHSQNQYNTARTTSWVLMKEEIFLNFNLIIFYR